jgi:plastocyanin
MSERRERIISTEPNVTPGGLPDGVRLRVIFLPMSRRLAPIAAALLLLVVGAGCGGGAKSEASGLTSSGDSAPADEVPDDVVVVDGPEAQVTALDNTFRAADIQVKPGTSVTWTNKGRNDHDVLPAEGDAWGVDADGFAPGGAYTTTFDRPGVYHYYCSIHGSAASGMVGTVVVAD